MPIRNPTYPYIHKMNRPGLPLSEEQQRWSAKKASTSTRKLNYLACYGTLGTSGGKMRSGRGRFSPGSFLRRGDYLQSG